VELVLDHADVALEFKIGSPRSLSLDSDSIGGIIGDGGIVCDEGYL
jgi:hypothetical protein